MVGVMIANSTRSFARRRNSRWELSLGVSFRGIFRFTPLSTMPTGRRVNSVCTEEWTAAANTAPSMELRPKPADAVNCFNALLVREA